LLLVIIPFQFYAGFRASGAVQASENERIELIKKIVRGVQASTNEMELRSFLASLPTPPPVRARLNAANYQAGELRRQRMERLIADASRNTVQALLMAIVFTGIAEKQGPLFGLFKRLGFFDIGISPGQQGPLLADN
jgi:hypothetical protein